MVMNSIPVPTYSSMSDIDIKFQKNHISDSDFYNDDDDEEDGSYLMHKLGNSLKMNINFSNTMKFN